MTTEKGRPSRTAFTIKRFWGFLKVFLRNKRATIGMAIIIGFCFLAIGAPLFTPYDSLGADPTFKGYLAGKAIAPTWLRYLPTFLGGNPSLSENFDVVPDAGAPKLWPEGQLNVTESNEVLTEVGFDPAVSFPFIVYGMRSPMENGSLAVSFKRSEAMLAGDTRVLLYHDFDYPYSGLPGIIVGNIEFLVNGTSKVEFKPREQWFMLMFTNTGETKTINLTLTVPSAAGLYLAGSATISEFFEQKSENAIGQIRGDWSQLGYRTWQEWLNGTATLPPHWGSMKWTVSGGSLVEKTFDEIRNSADPRYLPMYEDTGNVTYYSFMNDTRICDPDLNATDNGPDIVGVRNWTLVSTFLKTGCYAGNKTIYVRSVEGFKDSDPVVIGEAGFEEANEISAVRRDENALVLRRAVLTDHSMDEPVTLNKQVITISEKIVSEGRSRTYYLVKCALTDDDAVYEISRPDLLWRVYRPSFPGNLNDPDPMISSWVVRRKVETLHVPVRFRVLFGLADQPLEKMTRWFPVAGRPVAGVVSEPYVKSESPYRIQESLSGKSENGHWVISRSSKGTGVSYIQFENRAEILGSFPLMPGRYRYCVELVFEDRENRIENVQTIVHVDDFGLRLLGTSYGLLGTDKAARDLFAQLIYGTRISLYIGILVAVMSVAIGLVVGLVAGYMGGLVDEGLMRFNDLLLVLPGLPLMIVLVAVLGAKIENLILLLGLLGWNGFARVVRSQVLSLKERPFIEAAKAAGAGKGHIIAKHILPNVMALVYVTLASSVPGAITAEAALAWLGFYDPSRMSWGRMLHDVFEAGATQNWWWIIPPGLCIAAIATAFILLGYALDEILNPKLRMRR